MHEYIYIQKYRLSNGAHILLVTKFMHYMHGESFIGESQFVRDIGWPEIFSLIEFSNPAGVLSKALVV